MDHDRDELDLFINMQNIKIQVPTAHLNFTPYAMARMSNGLFKASENYKGDTQLLNFFLLCASIELGLKSTILSKNNSKTKKSFLKTNIRHDIEKAYEEFKKDFSKEKLLDQGDINIIKKINPFYKKRGLEYITIDVIFALMTGMSSFPALSELQNVALKINSFLQKNKFFINN